MYQDAVQAIHDHLVQKSLTSGLTYTAELIPERNQGGELLVSLLTFTTRVFFHLNSPP